MENEIKYKKLKWGRIEEQKIDLVIGFWGGSASASMGNGYSDQNPNATDEEEEDAAATVSSQNATEKFFKVNAPIQHILFS